MAEQLPDKGNAGPRAEAVGDDLEEFVRSAFAIDSSDPGFDRGVDLFDAGYVDSVGLAEVLAFINDTYGVDIPDDQLLSEEFASIDGMAAVICGMTSRGAVQANSATEPRPRRDRDDR